jgi:hypothetical protein
VIENNWAAYNGGAGFIYTKHKEGVQIVVNNTSYGNMTDPLRLSYGGVVGEYQLVSSSNVQIYNNIGQATAPTVFVTPPESSYGMNVANGDASLIIDGNWFVNTANATVTITNATPAVVTWTGSNFPAGQIIKFTTTGTLPSPIAPGAAYYVIAAGLGANSFEISTTNGGSAVNTTTAGSGTHTATVVGQDTAVGGPSGQFAYGGRNILGVSPAFANPTNPGAPSCGSATSVVNCMAATIANFRPTAAGALGMGYQAPQNIVPGIGASQDALFPAWLCNVILPAGLITKHC